MWPRKASKVAGSAPSSGSVAAGLGERDRHGADRLGVRPVDHAARPGAERADAVAGAEEREVRGDDPGGELPQLRLDPVLGGDSAPRVGGVERTAAERRCPTSRRGPRARAAGLEPDPAQRRAPRARRTGGTRVLRVGDVVLGAGAEGRERLHGRRVGSGRPAPRRRRRAAARGGTPDAARAARVCAPGRRRRPQVQGGRGCAKSAAPAAAARSRLFSTKVPRAARCGWRRRLRHRQHRRHAGVGALEDLGPLGSVRARDGLGDERPQGVARAGWLRSGAVSAIPSRSTRTSSPCRCRLLVQRIAYGWNSSRPCCRRCRRPAAAQAVARRSRPDPRRVQSHRHPTRTCEPGRSGIAPVP